MKDRLTKSNCKKANHRLKRAALVIFSFCVTLGIVSLSIMLTKEENPILTEFKGPVQSEYVRVQNDKI